MIKNIVRILIVALAFCGGYYFGNKQGVARGVNQAAQNYSKAKREMGRVQIPKKSGPDSASMLRALLGKWQSIADTSFVREFTASSTVIDYYAKKKTSTDNLTIFSAINPDPNAGFPIDNGVAYLKQVDVKGNQAEGLYFRVSKITATELELVYMGRGDVLSFKKVSSGPIR